MNEIITFCSQILSFFCTIFLLFLFILIFFILLLLLTLFFILCLIFSYLILINFKIINMFSYLTLINLSIKFQNHLLCLFNNLNFTNRLRLEILLTQFNRLNKRIRFSLIIFYCTQYVIVLNYLWCDFIQKPWFTHKI